MRFAIFACIFGVAFAPPPNANAPSNYFDLPESQWTQPETREVGLLGLPSGASLIVPNINTNFDCTGKGYGYFADMSNNCQIFHVCHPSTGPKQESTYYHFTHVCPSKTRFDQKKLVCLNENHPELIQCAESGHYYPATEQRFNEPAPEAQFPFPSHTNEQFHQTQVSQIIQKSAFNQHHDQSPLEAGPAPHVYIPPNNYSPTKSLPTKTIARTPETKTVAGGLKTPFPKTFEHGSKTVHAKKTAPVHYPAVKAAPLPVVRYNEKVNYVRPAQIPEQEEYQYPNALSKAAPTPIAQKPEIFEQKSVPFEQKTVPFEQKTVPFEQKTVPFEQKTVPFEQKTVPFEQKTVPFEQKTVPFEQKTVPFEQKAVAFEQKAVAFEQKHEQKPIVQEKHFEEQKPHYFEEQRPHYEQKQERKVFTPQVLLTNEPIMNPPSTYQTPVKNPTQQSSTF